jgi:hypothetical protein|tara:strand:- start:47 stop:295 length:249 start_codon:yes stop_codon:yes gene_type:complete
MVVIKEQIRGLNSLAELNELSQYINQCKTMLGKTSLSVGSDVYVVQKTKRTPGVVKKINQTRAVVEMRGRSYNVPFSMLELM